MIGVGGPRRVREGLGEELASVQAHAARNAVLLVFGVNGLAVASWTSRIPDVKRALNLSAGQLSLLLLALSVGSLCGLPVAGRIARALGTRAAIRLAVAVSLPGLLLVASAISFHAPMLLVAIGLFVTGLGMGVWDVAQNIEGTVVERDIGQSIMPWFHAAFSAGTVVAALIGAALTLFKVPIAVHLGAVALAAAIVVWSGTGRFLPAREATAQPADAPAAAAGPSAVQRSAWTEPRTLFIGVMVLAAAFTEGTANDWMAVAFVEGHGLSAALGVVALAVFLVFMTCGRIFGTRLLDRYGRVGVLRVMFGAAVFGCLLVVFGPEWLAFVGAAIWGVGASLGFPVGISAAGDDPQRASFRISVVSTIGYGAFLAGPPLLGFLGDHFGVLHAMLAVGAICVLAMLVAPVAKPPASTTLSRG